MTGQRIMQLFRQEPLLICILLAVIMGMVTGAVLRGSHLSARNIELIGKLHKRGYRLW